MDRFIQPTLRPWISTGVALVGTGMIAVTPVLTPTLDLHLPAIQLTAVDVVDDPVGDGGSVDPLTLWSDVWTTAWANIQGLSQEAADTPTLMQAVMDNQIAYAQALSDAGHDAFTILSGQLSNLPGILQDAMTQFSAGDISAAMTEVSNYLMQLPFLVMRPMQEAWGQVAQSIANNYANVVDAFFGDGGPVKAEMIRAVGDPWQLLSTAPLLPWAAVNSEFADITEDIVTAWNKGDYTAVLSDVLNAPANLTGAFLNGYGSGDVATEAEMAVMARGVPGLLTNPDGPDGFARGTFANLLDVRAILEEAIVPFRSATQAVSDTAAAVNPDEWVDGLAGMLSNGLNDLGSALHLDLGDLPADVGSWVVALLG